jgi:glycosyltransferase involved in cell wall biosynthesis
MRESGVTLVGPVAPPPGGIASHVADLARLLARHRVRAEVVAPERRGAGLGRFFWRALTDVVHVHVHGHSHRAWLLAAGCSAAPRAVLTVHSGLAPAFVARHPALVRAACARYAAVIAVSAAVGSALTAAGVEAARLFQAPAFLEEALADRLPPAGLAALRRRHPILLCAAGAPGPEYAVGLLLSAFAAFRAHHPEAGLILYGPGLRRPELLGAGVYLRGELDRAEALGVVAACDLFVRPTLADGDATSVREALALGCRVVASDAAARPTGVVLHRSGDAPSLAAALQSALEAPPPPRTDFPTAQQTLLGVYRRLGLPIATESVPCVELPAA